VEALKLAPLTEVAAGIGRAYSTVQAYKYGQRRVTPTAARDLARWLRKRAQEFERAAEALESAAEKEERR
jgi:hypothetical protein